MQPLQMRELLPAQELQLTSQKSCVYCTCWAAVPLKRAGQWDGWVVHNSKSAGPMPQSFPLTGLRPPKTYGPRGGAWGALGLELKPQVPCPRPDGAGGGLPGRA